MAISAAQSFHFLPSFIYDRPDEDYRNYCYPCNSRRNCNTFSYLGLIVIQLLNLQGRLPLFLPTLLSLRIAE